MEKLLELKELAEKRESARLERTQELANEKIQNRRLRELNVSMLYNPRYIEERERYLTNLNVLRVSYNHRY
ncbi:hypothetical protein ES705_47554 [subsurface metagenome]